MKIFKQLQDFPKFSELKKKNFGGVSIQEKNDCITWNQSVCQQNKEC